MGGHYQQEVDLLTLFKDVAGEYVHMATEPAQVRQLMNHAVRIAKAERGCDVHNHAERRAGDGCCEVATTKTRRHPYWHWDMKHPKSHRQRKISERAARVLNEGKKVAILVGAGALHATDEVIETADKLGAEVTKALLGKSRAARRSAIRDRFDRAPRHAGRAMR